MTVRTPSPEVVVLGAGLAGLGCAHELERAGQPYRILEAEDEVGGLARSEHREGFTFDFAGHWLHLADPLTRGLFEELLGPEARWVKRSAAVYIHGTFVPYPLQTNTWALPTKVREECLSGFLATRRARPKDHATAGQDSSFQDFVLRTFGTGMARHFFFPYNQKLWATPLEDLAARWPRCFVPSPPVEEVLQGAERPAAVPVGYNAAFLYPADGGIGTLAERLRRRLTGTIELQSRVISVDTTRKLIRTSENRVIPYARLVSTIPLSTLVPLCGDAPSSVQDAAGALRAVSVTCVNVAVRAGTGWPPPYHWVYFPDPLFAFYRAGCSSAAVPSLAPPGYRALWAEFSHREPRRSADLERQAVQGLRKCGLIQPDEAVLFTFTRTIPCGYVIFDHSYVGQRRIALDWLRTAGIEPAGRYGHWSYFSMEQSFLDGQSAAHRILEAHGLPSGETR